jgi:5-hydroxyisourate hydrolase-like protein (transthyretin family)
MLRAIAALVAALALAVVPALAASADDAPVGTVSVTVTDGVGGPALAGMSVNLMGSSMSSSAGVSDANGNVTFTGVANDWYSVSVGDPAQQFMSTVTDHFEITDAAPTATETVALSRFPTGTGVVTGHIVDKNTGAPLSGIMMSLSGTVTRFVSATTDSNGDFTFSALPVDVDFIFAFAPGYASFQLSPADVNNDTTDLGDLRFAPLTSSISGHVTDSDGNPVANMPVEVLPSAAETDLGPADAQTDADGYYTTSWNGAASLAAGTYTISTGLHGTVFAAQNIPVTVHDGADLTVDITLVPRLSGIVTGHVEDSTGASLSGICVFALDPTTRQPGAVDITDAGGNWAFPDMTVGSYLFRMRSCENPVEYGASYQGGTTPATATVVDVHAGDELALDTTVLLPEATITGHVDLVTPSGHAPLPADRGVIVQTWQWSGNEWVIFDADTADTVGTHNDFTVHDLPAGDYRVEFFDQLTGKRAYATQYWSQSNTAGSPTIAGASTITLATGASRTGIDAHLSTVRPADVPDAVTTDSLASGDEKTLTDSDTVAPGQHLTLSLGAEHAGEWVSVWGHSTPTLLADWVEVSADGTVQVTVPTTFPTGAHRLVAQTADGTVIGWEPFTVSDSAVVTPPAGSSVALPAKALGVPRSTTTATTDAASPVTADAPAPTPSATASADSSAGSSAEASSGSGHKATSPVVSPASGGLPVWLLVLIVGLGALIVVSVIIAIARRARA